MSSTPLPQTRNSLPESLQASIDLWLALNMAISVNSVLRFNSTKWKEKDQHGPISLVGGSAPNATNWFAFVIGRFDSRTVIKKRSGLRLLVADSDQVGTSISDNQHSSVNPSSVDSLGGSNRLQTSQNESESKTSNGSMASSDVNKQTGPSLQSAPKRSPLTARERLKAARVFSRYTESKTSKPEMGSKVLEALRESDKGKKRSGLPEAPTNLFDDSKRGLPKQGWTFEFPGGADLFFIVFSFVFISTVMFATTYVVWKSGAIHFNEY